MLPTGAAAALDGLARLETMPCSAAAVTLHAGQLLLLPHRDWPPSRTQPRRRLRALVQPCPARDPSAGLRAVLADVETMPAMPAAAKEQLAPHGRVRWDVPVALETLASGETRWLQHRQRLAGPLQRVPRDFLCPVSGICSTLARPW